MCMFSMAVQACAAVALTGVASIKARVAVHLYVRM
jgi:hypothetical protein